MTITGAALQRLFVWLSPAFPIGGFAWSAGLETAIAQGRVDDAATCRAWIEGALTHGGTRNDSIVIAAAHAAGPDPEKLAGIAELHVALIPASERRAETTITGGAFCRAITAWDDAIALALPADCPYPVALGAAAAAALLPIEETLLAYITAWVQAQVSVAVRLVPIGQGAGLEIQAELEPAIAALAAFAASASLDDLGGIAYASDIAQMQHETLPTRIFRS